MSTGPTTDLATAAHQLLLEQHGEWELLRTNYANLASAQTRQIQIDGFVMRLQYNPHRITSSSAKVDAESIRKRPCFLCLGNLPAEQRGVSFGDYVVLANPFPIFPEHFTIPHREHLVQQIARSFDVMLQLARALSPRYFVFYNGPRCGASAPDHLHFQAASVGVVPFESEYATLRDAQTRTLVERSNLHVFAVEQYLRNFIALESSSENALTRAFEQLVAIMGGRTADEEPMLNVLAWFDKGQYRVVVFPRARHRPAVFFAEGDKQILLSPAAIDLAGLCVTPREKDFHTVTAEHLTQMFCEVCLSPDDFRALCSEVARVCNTC